MASEVGITNFALTLLGESRITSLDDDLKAARETKAIFEIVRDGLLATYNWSFAFTRTQLPALATPPTFGYANAFQMPSDCIRAVVIGDYFAGLDMTDYRGSPTEDYKIEGTQILTDDSAPLNFQYVKRVTDAGNFDAAFTEAFGCKLASYLAEPLTQSDSKRVRAEGAFSKAIKDAIRANAIILPPKHLPDSEWIVGRL